MRAEPELGDIELMLATPHRPFSREGWVYEFKYDGYRVVSDGRRLLTRNKKDATAWYPQIVAALRTLGRKFIIDGEVCLVDEKGIPHFEAMRGGGNREGLQLNYYAFDLLFLNGRDLRGTPLLERKERLRELISKDVPRIGFVAHVATAGEALYNHAVSIGLEGIVAKRAQSHYVGGRNRDWFKCKQPGFHDGWERPLTRPPAAGH